MLRIIDLGFLAILILTISNCNNSDNRNLSGSNGNKAGGNLETLKKFNLLSQRLRITTDSLKNRPFLDDTLKKIDCKCIKLFEKDYYNDSLDLMIREIDLVLQDTISIHILAKEENSSTEYIYFYKGKTFQINNYFGGMYVRDSEINFHFDTRECYSKTPDIFIMREQPSRWTGLANQFSFYQIVDFKKMEISQFAERDNKLW